MSGTSKLAWDTDAAVKFLRQWPCDFPVLSASHIDPISQKKGTFETKSFPAPTDWKAVWDWIETRQGRANIYFSVNPVIGIRKNDKGHEQKTERTDIKSLVALHVDVDARVGETQAEARERIVALLSAYSPKPSVVTFSGGGAQGFWLLETPLPIDGDLEKAEDAKRYNITLERDLGGDACHNIDRIMRVPGTINVPDTRKVKKGREPMLAEIVYSESTKYPIDKFMAAPKIQEGEAGLTGGVKVVVSVPGNVARLDSLDDPRLAKVKGKTKVLILHGTDPDEPSTLGRSERLFAVVCDLVRAGVSDEVIYAIITDSDFKISESVLDKKDVRRYALRQIEQSKACAVDELLAELNSRFAVIENLGGRCRIIEDVADDAMDGRNRLSIQTFDDFRNRFMNRVRRWIDAKGDAQEMPLGAWWLSSPDRRQYCTLTFSPGKEVVGAYNMWKGFAVMPNKTASCQKFLEHVRQNICDGDQAHYTYLISWMARMIQFPGTPGEVATVLRGREGTGKGMFFKHLGYLLGRHFLHITNPKHLVGNFNAHLRDCVFLFADEAFFAGDKQHSSLLKTLITEETLMVEKKGVDAEQARNFVHLGMSSNLNWVVPAGADARRFFVLDVADNEMQNSTYFEAIRTEMEKEGGYEALLHFLLMLDISSFDVRKVPRTEALRDQQMLSMGHDEEWMLDKLQRGTVVGAYAFGEPIPFQALMSDYYEFCDNIRTNHRMGPQQMRSFLRRVCPEGFPTSTKVKYVESTKDGANRREYVADGVVFAKLDESRAHWTKTHTDARWDDASVPTPKAAKSNSDTPF